MRQSKRDSAARRAARARVLQVAAFLLAFYILSAMSLMIPLRPTTSEEENRNLTAFPKLTISSLVDGSFFDGINLWFADTFPLRGQWIAASDSIKRLYGSAPQEMEVFGEVGESDAIPTVDRTTTKTVMTFPTSPAPAVGQGGMTSTEETTTPTSSNTNKKPAGQDNVPAQQFGAVIAVGDSGFEYYNFVQSVADDYIAMVNRASAQLNGIATVYDIIVPTSMDICVEPTLRASLNSSLQKEAIDYFYANMNDSVKVVDIYDAMVTAHKNGEYLYYRTDHHWTALGAYRAYEQFCNVRQRAPTPLSAFTLREYGGYLGSFYNSTNKLPAMKNNPDIVQAFVPPSTNTMTITWRDGSKSEYPIVTDVSDWSALYKYNCFIGGDNPLSVIQNPNKTDGSACLLIKESFGNAFAPFLVEDYETVYIVDYRYISGVDGTKLKEFVTQRGIQEVLFLNNISATRSGSLVDSMTAFVG
ncbi:MAG: hypothetical protein IKV35_03095 [Clostridia bacterium]|nr:hypothetical protein [Clostridia bacterium]